MSFDAISLKILLLETKKEIAGRTVDKIMQHRGGEFAVILRNENGPSILLISINPNFPAFFHSDTHKINFMNSSSNYQLLLKKHLEGARVIDIRQIHSDRILALYLLKKDSFSETKYILFFEFMGKHSNSFLYEGFDETGDLDPQRVAGAVNFSHGLCEFVKTPSKTDITTIGETGGEGSFENESGGTPDCSGEIINSSGSDRFKDLIKKYTGLSPFLCEAAKASDSRRALGEIAGVFKTSDREELTRLIEKGRSCENSIFKIYNTAIYSRGAGEKKKNFVYPFDLRSADPSVSREAECDTLNECWARFYILRDSDHITAGLRSRIAKLRAAAEKKKNMYTADFNVSSDHHKYSGYGSLIISAMNDIKSRGDNDKNLASIELIGETVPLDGRFTVSDNAQRYFKLSKRLRAKNEYCKNGILALDNILLRIEKCRERLDSPSAMFSAEFCSAMEKDIILIASDLIRDKRIRKKFLGEFGGELKIFKSCVAAKNAGPGETSGGHAGRGESSKHYRQFESVDGFPIFVGRSDAGNDYILSKIAGQQDHWLHVKDFRGSSVILKTPKNADPKAVERAVAEAALYAAHYSQGRNATRIFVSCALRKYVKKLKRVAGKVTYTNENSILVDIARLEEKFGRAVD